MGDQVFLEQTDPSSVRLLVILSILSNKESNMKEQKVEVTKVSAGIEIPLNPNKPMVMADEDLQHFKAMFTACVDKFDNWHEACTTAIEAMYMTDLHVNLLKPNTYSTHVQPYADFSFYVEYPVYNACTGFTYDVVLRIGKHPDGKYSVDFCRQTDKVKE